MSTPVADALPDRRRRSSGFAIALCADAGRTLAALEAPLHENERAAAAAHEAGRRRQFALGRRAAQLAIARLGDIASAHAWVRNDAHGAPEVAGAVGMRVAIAHSARLAVALAWRGEVGTGKRAPTTTRVGIDLERARETDVAHSPYAFSRREQRLILSSGLAESRAGLCAWVAKEAAWKALRLPPAAGPDVVELESFDAEAGRAIVRARRTWPGRTTNTVVRETAHAETDGW